MKQLKYHRLLKLFQYYLWINQLFDRIHAMVLHGILIFKREFNLLKIFRHFCSPTRNSLSVVRVLEFAYLQTKHIQWGTVIRIGLIWRKDTSITNCLWILYLIWTSSSIFVTHVPWTACQVYSEWWISRYNNKFSYSITISTSMCLYIRTPFEKLCELWITPSVILNCFNMLDSLVRETYDISRAGVKSIPTSTTGS